MRKIHPVQPGAFLLLGTICSFPPTYIFPTPTWSPKNDRMTDVKVVRGLSPWRPKRPTPEAGNAAGPRRAPSRGPASRPGRAVESRSHAPARPAGSTPASQTSCPGTSAKSRRLWTSPGSPSRLQRPGFNVVRAAPPVPLRGGRPGIWQGDVARVAGRRSSNQKRGVVVTSSEGAFASEFGLTATSELGVSVCVCVCHALPSSGWQGCSLRTSRCQADISASTQTFHTHCAQRRGKNYPRGRLGPGVN